MLADAPSELKVGTEINIAVSESFSSPPSEDQLPNADAQAGVQDIEATTVAWTKEALIIAYILLWVIYFVETMLAGVTVALTPYITSAFALHSLTPTVSILSSVIGGVTNLTLAKILDVFGRPQGYLFCVCIAVIGLVMMAACNGVEAYAAAMVFYTVGNNGVQYSISVFVADTSSLRNRGLMQAIVTSSNLITCWLAGPVSQGFLKGPGWRWCFGMFTLLVPAVTLPLFGVLMNNYVKAKQLGLIPKRASGRTAMQSLVHYCREFDAIGLFLISAGVALFLLPLNLYTMQARGWHSPLVITMLVVGILFMIAFVIWEKYFAAITFMPHSLLLDRTVLGACLLSATLFMSYSLWFSYLSSFLQVVKDLSVEQASYVAQTYTVVGVLCAIAVGLIIHRTGRFKPVCLYFGIPISIFGLGLIIHFRRADGSIGYIVMCLIFIAMGQGVVVICAEIAILAAASHVHVAVCIAVLGIFSNIGGAIGSTVAAAIWQDMMPNKLMQYLPIEDLENIFMIYADITTQLLYAVGSPTRTAIQRAYEDTQLRLLTVGCAVWAVALVAVLIWRNINVADIKQTKGHVW